MATARRGSRHIVLWTARPFIPVIYFGGGVADWVGVSMTVGVGVVGGGTVGVFVGTVVPVGETVGVGVGVAVTVGVGVVVSVGVEVGVRVTVGVGVETITFRWSNNLA